MPKQNEYGEYLDGNGYSNSFFDSEPYCIYCHTQSGKIDRHEIFHGPYRDKSKRYGCWCYLCHEHHMMLHCGELPELDIKLKTECQAMAMRYYGWNTDKFISIFGKNYI